LGKLSGASLEILRIQKPEAVKSPKIFVWLDLPRKRIKTKKTKGFLLAVNYYCVYDRKRTSNRSAMSVFFYTYGLALAAVGIAFNKAPEESNSLRWKFVSYFQVYGINDILCIVVVAYLF